MAGSLSQPFRIASETNRRRHCVQLSVYRNWSRHWNYWRYWERKFHVPPRYALQKTHSRFAYPSPRPAPGSPGYIQIERRYRNSGSVCNSEDHNRILSTDSLP